MSSNATRHTWTIDVSSSAELIVLLALAEFADDCGECFPSIRRLAQMTKLSSRHVRRSIKSLEKSGHISVKRRKWDAKTQRSSLYKLLYVEILEVLDPLGADTVSGGYGLSVSH